MKSIPKRAGMSEEKRADKGLGDATKRVERKNGQIEGKMSSKVK